MFYLCPRLLSVPLLHSPCTTHGVMAVLHSGGGLSRSQTPVRPTPTQSLYNPWGDGRSPLRGWFISVSDSCPPHSYTVLVQTMKWWPLSTQGMFYLRPRLLSAPLLHSPCTTHGVMAALHSGDVLSPSQTPVRPTLTQSLYNTWGDGRSPLRGCFISVPDSCPSHSYTVLVQHMGWWPLSTQGMFYLRPRLLSAPLLHSPCTTHGVMAALHSGDVLSPSQTPVRPTLTQSLYNTWGDGRSPLRGCFISVPDSCPPHSYTVLVQHMGWWPLSTQGMFYLRPRLLSAPLLHSPCTTHGVMAALHSGDVLSPFQTPVRPTLTQSLYNTWGDGRSPLRGCFISVPDSCPSHSYTVLVQHMGWWPLSTQGMFYLRPRLLSAPLLHSPCTTHGVMAVLHSGDVLSPSQTPVRPTLTQSLYNTWSDGRSPLRGWFISVSDSCPPHSSTVLVQHMGWWPLSTQGMFYLRSRLLSAPLLHSPCTTHGVMAALHSGGGLSRSQTPVRPTLPQSLYNTWGDGRSPLRGCFISVPDSCPPHSYTVLVQHMGWWPLSTQGVVYLGLRLLSAPLFHSPCTTHGVMAALHSGDVLSPFQTPVRPTLTQSLYNTWSDGRSPLRGWFISVSDSCPPHSSTVLVQHMGWWPLSTQGMFYLRSRLLSAPLLHRPCTTHGVMAALHSGGGLSRSQTPVRPTLPQSLYNTWGDGRSPLRGCFISVPDSCPPHSYTVLVQHMEWWPLSTQGVVYLGLRLLSAPLFHSPCTTHGVMAALHSGDVLSPFQTPVRPTLTQSLYNTWVDGRSPLRGCFISVPDSCPPHSYTDLVQHMEWWPLSTQGVVYLGLRLLSAPLFHSPCTTHGVMAALHSGDVLSPFQTPVRPTLPQSLYNTWGDGRSPLRGCFISVPDSCPPHSYTVLVQHMEWWPLSTQGVVYLRSRLLSAPLLHSPCTTHKVMAALHSGDVLSWSQTPVRPTLTQSLYNPWGDGRSPLRGCFISVPDSCPPHSYTVLVQPIKWWPLSTQGMFYLGLRLLSAPLLHSLCTTHGLMAALHSGDVLSPFQTPVRPTLTQSLYNP